MSEQNDTATAEVWKPLTGYNHPYEISDAGTIRRPLVDGRMKVVKGSESTRGGYRQYTLRTHDGRLVKRYGHQLVLTAFVGPCPDGLVCRHENDNPLDNRLSNLSWGTQLQNIHDCIRHGNKVDPPKFRGVSHPNAKLDEAKVREIRRLVADGMTQEKVAHRIGVRPVTVSAVVTRRLWKHVR